MTDLSKDLNATAAADLLTHYSFDLGFFSAEQLVLYWRKNYPSQWVRAAVIEALYQGRYKAISVGQILSIWHRRGQPICHFNYEFERMICGTSSLDLSVLGSEVEGSTHPSEKSAEGEQSTAADAEPALEIRGDGGKPPIHQYVPIIPRFETTVFYAKLKAAAETDETDAAAVDAESQEPEADRPLIQNQGFRLWP